MTDPDLSDILQSWQRETPPAPRFNAEVWARIEAARDAPWAAAAGLAARFGLPAQTLRWALPLGASIALTLAAGLGAGMGYVQGSRVYTDRMAAAYVRTIDPMQQVGTAQSR
jgi:hypothetical protein